MSSLMLALTGLAYLIGAIDQLRKHDFGHAAVFAGYALGNAGLLFAVR